MSQDETLLALVAGQARDGAKLDALLSRVDRIDTRLAGNEARSEQAIADLSNRIAKLERWQAKVIGLAAGIGVGSGAISAVITQALSG